MSYPSWMPEHLRPFWDADELSLFRALIVGEASTQSFTGKLAVGWVAKNRMQYARWSLMPWFSPDSHRENILAHAQFSCFWADFPKRRGEMELSLVYPSRFYLADAAAQAVLNETQVDPTIGVSGMGADFYFNPKSCPIPAWAKPLIAPDGHLVRPGYTRTVKIEDHDFYCSQL